jgi:2-iminobutanoate/2-iminopropanoate deaminase
MLAVTISLMPRSLVESRLFEPIGPYSHAVVAGGQVFISGTPGVNPDTGQLAGKDAYLQTHQILTNFQSILAASDATLDDIVNVQVNLVNVADFPEMNRAYAEFFAEPYPARTVIGIAALPKPGALLTMNAVAVLKK